MNITIAHPKADLTPDQKFAYLVNSIEEQRKISRSDQVTISIHSLTHDGLLSNDDLRSGLTQLVSTEQAVWVVDFHYAGIVRDDATLAGEGFDASDIRLEAQNVVFGTHYEFNPNDKITLSILPRFEFVVSDIDKLTTRRITFDIQNGHLLLDRKRIYTASLTGPEYHFLSFLWDNWSTQVPYKDINIYVRGKMGRDVADIAKNFCAKMKSNIKHDCAVIDTIITIPTSGHYMMADPIRATSVAVA